MYQKQKKSFSYTKYPARTVVICRQNEKMINFNIPSILNSFHYTPFFYKQPIYKQLDLRMYLQFIKQLVGLIYLQ